MKTETNDREIFLLCALLISGLTLSACDDDDGNSNAGPDTSSATSANTDTDLDAGDATPDAGDELPTDTGDDTDTGTDSGTESGAAFGEPCSEEIKCASDGVCHEFGQLGSVCTITCESADQCPVGSEGQKCNRSNVCRP
jgi:hypothetical protein